jgi:hypothetical protein
MAWMTTLAGVGLAALSAAAAFAQTPRAGPEEPPRRRWSRVICAGVLACATRAGLAQTPPDYGLDFVTVGAPGNRGTVPSEVPANPSWSVGGVGYDYRIMRTHVSNSQYLEFVNAYAPYWRGDPNDIELRGYWGLAEPVAGGGWQYVARSGSDNYAARITWEMAARYTNWLHNGKVTQAWAFNGGVYDLGNAGLDPEHWQQQVEHSSNARFWIPTLNEYDKAVYYDPDRYGPGSGGYWQYPNSSNAPLIMGLPENGGETIGDLLWQTNPGLGLGAWDIGQYPHVQSPWGLTDVSAMVPTMTQTILFAPGARLHAGGSLAGDTVYETWDRLDLDMGISVLALEWGSLRLASVVPGPGTLVICGISALALLRRRRTICYV